MSNATIAKENRDQKFQMPEVKPGQVVLFYPRARVSSQNRIIGYVSATSRENIEINVSGLLHEGVRHKDDPMLQTNPHSQEFGCWELSPRDVAINKAIRDLTTKVNELERKLNK